MPQETFHPFDPENLEKNYAGIYKIATLSTKWLVWASDLLLQLPGIDTKR